MDRGHGLQVVNVKENHEFELNRANLESVLMREDVRDLPVMVVSVAGAFRCGKSFLLDFFLRYLSATDAQRNDGSWLGDPQQPLVGFSWRTGADRNTIGIHVWSEPAVMTLPSGNKVAVVLMDTQGTFDGKTPIRVSVTTFALSVLLSSVQIYNLMQNLKEDDLQHLQLFTKYSQLAGNSEQPLQRLMFVIRDWMFESDHEFGEMGGRQLLNKWFEDTTIGTEELQEVRQQIRSAFERIDCFLVAHPGLKICKPDFSGKLEDLEAPFKDCLLKLMPSLFDRMSLTPKHVNGRQVTARELMVYFHTYLDVFSSGEIPTPKTMVQATAQAGVLLAIEAARASYASAMDEACGSAAPAQAAAALIRLNARASAAARKILTDQKTLADRQMTDSAVTQILQEFDDRLWHYTALNDAKLRNVAEEATLVYVRQMLRGGEESQLCRSPRDLDTYHEVAKDLALQAFHAKFRTDESDDENREENALINTLSERFRQLSRISELNSNLAMAEALNEYKSRVDVATRGGNPCMSSNRLLWLHEDASEVAMTLFRNKRSDSSNTSDRFTEQLSRDINVHYERYKQVNDTNNEATRVAVIAAYQEKLSRIILTKCVASIEFKREEEAVRTSAVEIFHSKRTYGHSDDDGDTSYDSIKQEMNRYDSELSRTNKDMNEAAITSAREEYCNVMDTNTRVSGIMKYINPVMWPARMVQLQIQLEDYHKEAKDKAINIFKQHRRNECVLKNGDEHFDKLKLGFKRLFEKYNSPFTVSIRGPPEQPSQD